METPTILKKVSEILASYIVKESDDQGHKLTGAMNDSIYGAVSDTVLEGFIIDYGYELNQGVKPGVISGEDAAHIAALTIYFQKRGYVNPENAARLTAKRHEAEGISTYASRIYSKTGERQNFIEYGANKAEPFVNQAIEAGMDTIFANEFNKQKSEKI